MTYKAYVRDAIHTALSNGPLYIKEVASRIGYSYGYTCEHLMHIRRDMSLDWDIVFLGHGNRDRIFLIKRGEMVNEQQEQHMKTGHDSWVRTDENKCVSIQKHCLFAEDSVVSPAAKDLYAKARLYVQMAEETLEKVRKL